MKGDAGFPVRVRFSKRGPVRFIGHRDVARNFERAFRIETLPLAFTLGFAPRPKVGFGLALSVGHESDAEYLDVELTHDPGADGPSGIDGFPEALSAALPRGLEVTGVAPIVDRAPSLQEAVTAVEYRIEVGHGAPGVPSTAEAVEDAVTAALAAPSLEITRTRKGREVAEDVRPAIRRMELLEGDASVALLGLELATQPRNARPGDVVAALNTLTGSRVGRCSTSDGCSEPINGSSASARGWSRSKPTRARTCRRHAPRERRNPCPTIRSPAPPRLRPQTRRPRRPRPRLHPRRRARPLRAPPNRPARRALRPAPTARPASDGGGVRGGGRNRKRPDGSGGDASGESTTSGNGGNGGNGDGSGPAARSSRPAGDPGRRPGSRSEDYTDPQADRGLTTDDLAESAAEDAGLRAPRVGDTRPAPAPPANGGGRPRIGDTRAATAGRGSDPSDVSDATGEAKAPRRRRRGGRGRGRSRGGESRPATVEADLGLDDGVAIGELDEAALERRRGQTRKGRPAGRYLMGVHVTPGTATQIAVLEGRALVEHSVSRPEDDDTSIDGNIYLGRVQNVLPGMEAAFIDIGTPKNGVLYRGDVAFDESEVEEKQPKIERLLKNGQMILVQVTKNPIGHKGARLTQEVSLAGRFVVMVPGQPKTYGISKRLPDDERKRLRRVLDGIKPEDAGLIVRTAAEGATPDELTRDMRRLRAQWEQISGLAARSKSAALLYKEPPLVVRRIREEFTKEYRGVSIDDRALYEEIRAYVDAIAPELAERIEFYDEAVEGLPLFERFHIHEQLVKALDRKVWLPSGGSLVIERTEALTVIDVNTGKNVGKSNLEETVFTNNLEAADEVARQLRLRDIGGIIVIDFIDMEIKKNRDAVLRGFKDALARDKTRTQVFEISELGLVEMTRKRISEGLVEAFSETCDVCHGRGFVVDESLLG